uniref:Uncharacterized protein n=1 Tax=Arundo donax TaxID=35708 RepID=A0A0A9GZZ8_ARUDO
MMLLLVQCLMLVLGCLTLRKVRRFMLMLSSVVCSVIPS